MKELELRLVSECLTASESQLSPTSKGRSHRIQPCSLTSLQMRGTQSGHRGPGMGKPAVQTGSSLDKAPVRSDTTQSRNVFTWSLNGPQGRERGSVWKTAAIKRVRRGSVKMSQPAAQARAQGDRRTKVATPGPETLRCTPRAP